MYSISTRQSLLERIKGGDEIAGRKFYELYRSLVWFMGNEYGLTDTEQRELLQEVMLDFFNAQGKFQYDSSKGHFRCYFRMLVTAQCIKIIKRRTPAVPYGVDIKNGFDESDDGDIEWRAFLLRRALKTVAKTMETTRVQCFKRCKLEHESPVKVAADLEISLTTAYSYCNVVMSRLKELMREYAEQEV